MMSDKQSDYQSESKKKLKVIIFTICIIFFVCGCTLLYIYLAPVLETDKEPGIRAGTVYRNLFSTSDRITPDSIYVLSYKAAPDGNRIALTYTDYGWDTTRADQYLGIFDVWTGELHQILHIEKPDITSQTNPGKWQSIHMAWSPDGQNLLYNLLSQENTPEFYIYNRLNQKITSATNLTGVFNEFPSVRIADLNWSPGLNVLVNSCFSDTSRNTHFDTYIINPDLTSTKTIISDSFLPQWLPDGKTIVYSCLEKWTSQDKNQDALETTGLCSYSIQDKQEKIITTEMKSGIWSSNGRFAVERTGGAEGEKPDFRVYNAILDRVYNLPYWVIR
jgi:Tol biopolymer transport system component